MNRVTRLSVGLFGSLFHVIAAGLLSLQIARASPGASLRGLVGPALAGVVAGFVVYSVIVTPYARKRLGTARRGVVLYDFLIGMVVEVAVVALASVLFALGSSAGTFAEGGIGGYLAAVASGSAFSFLWVIGSAFTEVLVLGNAAGFLGFILLKRLGPGPPGSASRGPGSA